MNTNSMLGRLRRIRWGVRATLTFGVAASVAANVLHAQQNPISQAISAWPPLALLLTAELVSRVPVHRKSLAALRVVATMVIAGIAAWVSYWHMAGVAARYGETDATPYLLPISVDGLIVVASICLVELAARIRAIEEDQTTSTPAVRSSTVVNHPVSALDDARTVPTIVPDTEPAMPPTMELAQVDEDQVLDDELIARAHRAAAQHRRDTGGDITRDQLRAKLRTSNATAGQLLQLVRANGNPTPQQPDGRRPIPTLGGPTR
jgi:Protein of unknown function (DUF2637)